MKLIIVAYYYLLILLQPNITIKTINDDFQKMIKTEERAWWDVLKVMIDVILYCTRNNLTHRGKSWIIGENICVIFLNTIELISHYHPQIAEHISTIKSKN